MGKSYTIKCLSPRETLGRYLAEQGFPGNSWEGYFNNEQKEFWYKKADSLIDFLRQKGWFNG